MPDNSPPFLYPAPLGLLQETRAPAGLLADRGDVCGANGVAVKAGPLAGAGNTCRNVLNWGLLELGGAHTMSAQTMENKRAGRSRCSDRPCNGFAIPRASLERVPFARARYLHQCCTHPLLPVARSGL